MSATMACPFCGDEAAEARMLAMLFAYVECGKCGAHGPMKWGVEAAYEAWNHRGRPEKS